MKIKPIYFLLSLTLFAKVLQAKDVNDFTPKNKSICFTENKGQFADQNYNPRPDVLFGGSDGQLAFHITRKGISYQLYRVDSYKEVEDLKTKEKRNEIDQQTIYRTDIKWLNANQNPVVKTDEELPGYDNYYLEQCPNGALNVRSYKGITLQNIYNNIDLHYYEKQGQLKYDYIVAPHADYKQIQLNVEGAILKLQDDGSLIIETPLGKIQEQPPLVYQNGMQLKARYTIKNNTIGFEVENYNENYELIIDPVIRLWGTYYGGLFEDAGMFTSLDVSGNVYMAGSTRGATGTLIATTGSHQSAYASSASYDAFLIKFSNNGVRLWGTYYGGMQDDYGFCCATDASGNIYMAGHTASSTGTTLATIGGHQTGSGGGGFDGFLVKFNSAGVRLWGTYYGSSGGDVANCCTTDVSGNVYLAGYTNNSVGTAIATPGSHQSASNGGNDGFLVKFSSSGVRLWGTYYGGTGTDLGYSCATDAMGNVYMAGYAASTSNTEIATTGSHQNVNNGGYDCFLVKFNSSGIRQWGTYYGGAGNENECTCSVDFLNNVYLTGYTNSNIGTSIATSGSHQSIFGGSYDAFLVQFNSSGVRQWGTYYGGTGDERCFNCTTDSYGNIFMVGYTSSSTATVMATVGNHQSTFGGGSKDGFLVKLNNNGVRLWGTYYGGSDEDMVISCVTDGSGNVIMTGATSSTVGTSIATAGSHQSTLASNYGDAFLVKFIDCITATPAVNGPVCTGATLSLTASMSSTVTPSYSWIGPNSFTAAVQNPTIGGLNVLNVGIYTLTINDGICTHTSTTQVNVVNSPPAITVNSGSICSGNSFTIIPGGANTYTVTGGNFIVSPNVSSSYSVSGTSSVGCVSSNFISTVTVYAIPVPTLTVNSGSICSGNSFVIIPGGANTYSVTGNNFTVSPNITSSYSVTGTSTAGCVSSNVVSTVTVHTTPTLVVNSGSICSGSSFTITPSGANSYTITGSNYTVSPITTTSYSLSGTGIDGCVSSGALSTITVYTIPTIAVSNGSICSGNSFTITPGGANTYTVTGGNFTVSPNTTSSYSITGTNTAGCVSSNVVSTVTVYTTPTVNVNSGSICSGTNFIITPSGANSYTITGGNYTVSPITTTSYSLNGTSIDGCVSNAVSTVTVYNVPTIAVNSGSMCTGNSFTITPAGANTYTVTGGNFTVSPNSTSSYSVKGTSTAGCVSSGNAVCTVTVNTTPTVSANSGSICSGNNFTVIPTGANSYSITGGSFIVNPGNTTTYSVTGTSFAGCISGNAMSTITVKATPTITVNSGSICNGNSFVIVPSGANTYTITGGNYTVSPNTTTSYSVAGTNTGGCISAYALSNVTVHALPILVVNSGSMCTGDSFTITPSGANTYTITGSNYTVSPVTTTSYSVTGMSTEGCVSLSNVVSTVIVNTTPTVSVNSGSICSGNTFIVTPSGANTYYITGGNFTVNPHITSSYSVTGTSIEGCRSLDAISNVTVFATPTLAVNSGSMCTGNSFTITPSSANTYTITGGNFTVNPVMTTSYSVTGTSTEGCVSSGNAICTVSVNTTPTLALTTGSICLGESFVIIPSGANTYTITGGSFTVSPNTTTSYSVIGMSSAGCISGEEQSSVSVDVCTGLNKNSWTDHALVKIYPNPSAGLLHIESIREAEVFVIDLQGRQVFQFHISNGANLISIEQIDGGVYFIEICDPLGKQVHRIIKQ